MLTTQPSVTTWCVVPEMPFVISVDKRFWWLTVKSSRQIQQDEYLEFEIQYYIQINNKFHEMRFRSTF